MVVGCLAAHWENWESWGGRCLGGPGSPLRVSDPFPLATSSLSCSDPPSQLQPQSSVVVRRLTSSRRPSSRGLPPRSLSLLWRFGSGVGCGSRRPPSLRLVVSPLLTLFHQSVRAAGDPLCRSGFSTSPPRSDSGRVFGQLCGPGLPPEARGHSLVVSECCGSGTSSPLRVSVSTPASSVHSWSSECSGRFAQPPLSGPRLRKGLYVHRRSQSFCVGGRPPSTFLRRRLTIAFRCISPRCTTRCLPAPM